MIDTLRPKVFSVAVTEEGDQYYVDEATQETTWDLPEDAVMLSVI